MGLGASSSLWPSRPIIGYRCLPSCRRTGYALAQRALAGRESLVLSTFGVALTVILLTLFARLVLGLTFLEGMLLGSIVPSIDAAAALLILRCICRCSVG
jgi:NhaP-type Na+/H+ and K+/H+ antiporter